MLDIKDALLKLTLTQSHTLRKSMKVLISSCKQYTLSFVSDDSEKKAGLVGASDFINNKISQYLAGKELPLSKAALLALNAWVGRQKSKMNSSDRLNEDEQQSPRAISISSFTVKCAIEAVFTSFSKSKNQEYPFFALYDQI